MPYPILGLTAEDWNVFNSIGTWVAGIGACSASVAALYLASRPPKQHALCSAELKGLSHINHAHKNGTKYKVIEVSITNISTLPITITRVLWRSKGLLGNGMWGGFLYNNPPDIFPNDDSPLPVTLEYGQSAKWYYECAKNRGDISSWSWTIGWESVRELTWLRTYLMRVEFVTSFGRTFIAKPDSFALQEIRKSAEWAKQKRIEDADAASNGL
jgi:hypothetical protein